MQPRFILLLLSLIAFYFSTNKILSQEHPRDKWTQPERILDSLGVKEGMIIGEAGAGEGYFTFKLSKRVGTSGKIYANDIRESALNAIKRQCKRNGINNIVTTLGETADPLFPVDSLDLVIMIMAFHDFEQPVKWLENLKKYITPSTPLIIIDCDPDRWGRGHDHFMRKDKVVRTVEKAGYKLVHIYMFLARDNIYVFHINKIEP